MHHTVVIRNVLLHPGKARVVRGVEQARALGTLGGETYQLMQYARLLGLFVRTHEIGPLVMLERGLPARGRRWSDAPIDVTATLPKAPVAQPSAVYRACILHVS